MTTRWRDARVPSLSSLFAMLTLLAVFTMHGPSSDHTMLMPGGSGHQAGMSAGQHAMHEAPMDAVRSAAGVAAVPRASEVGDHRMTHEDCVATLRADQAHAVPADVVVTTHVLLESGQRVRPAAATDRAPPRPPDLDELCISRT